MPIDLDHLADAFTAHHVDASAIHDLHGVAEALSSIGIDPAALTPEQIDSVIRQIDSMLTQHGVHVASAAHPMQFAGNPGWYQGSSGTWYHNDPSGHYDGNWSNR